MSPLMSRPDKTQLIVQKFPAVRKIMILFLLVIITLLLRQLYPAFTTHRPISYASLDETDRKAIEAFASAGAKLGLASLPPAVLVRKDARDAEGSWRITDSRYFGINLKLSDTARGVAAVDFTGSLDGSSLASLHRLYNCPSSLLFFNGNASSYEQNLKAYGLEHVFLVKYDEHGFSGDWENALSSFIHTGQSYMGAIQPPNTTVGSQVTSAGQ